MFSDYLPLVFRLIFIINACEFLFIFPKFFCISDSKCYMLLFFCRPLFFTFAWVSESFQFVRFWCLSVSILKTFQVFKYWPAFCWTPPSFFIFKWITEMKSKPRVINVSRFRIRDLKLSNHVTKLNYLPIKRKQNYLWNRYIHVSQGGWKWLLLFLAVLVSLQNWLHIKKIDDKLKSAPRHWRCSWQAGVGGQWFN